MRKLIISLLVLTLPLGFLGAQSKDNTESTSEDQPASGLLGEIPIGSKNYPVNLSIRGYVDTYYSFNLNDTGATENPGRIFDQIPNQFRLGLVQTKFVVASDDWEVVADLTHGPNAESGNFGNLTGGSSITSTAIKQAYGSVTLQDFTLTVGQYNTHIGYEVIEASLNSHYSLSNLFGWGPFYHVGLKIDYSFSEELGFMIGVVNGWDSDDNFDNNLEKSITGQIYFGYIKDLEIYLNYMGGDESKEVGGWRNIFDLTSIYALNSHLGFGLNAALGNDSVAQNVNAEIWFGVAVYIDYTINPDSKHTYMISIRNEYFNDDSGVRGFGPANTYGLTVTGTISLYNGAFLIKPEFRLDMSDETIYANEKSQSTVALSFIGVY